jgi:hypothetical protein
VLRDTTRDGLTKLERVCQHELMVAYCLIMCASEGDRAKMKFLFPVSVASCIGEFVL